MFNANPRDFLIVSLTTIGPIGLDLQRRGFRVEALGLAGPLSMGATLFRLRRLLRGFAPDIVQTWMYHADLFGGLMARSLGLKVVWSIRNTVVPSEGLAQRLISKLCAHLSWWLPRAIVCVAKSTVPPYVRAGYDPAKMVVIGNGLEFETFDRALTREKQRSGNVANILCVGRFHRDKGQDILLDAAVQLLSGRKDLSFVFAGRGCSWDNPTFRELVNRYGIGEHVVALGERSDIPELLTDATIFCLPSRTEGFPNGLAEAMAMNRACVAADVGDAADLLGGTGILVPAQRPAELANALARALSMPAAELDAMGMASGRRVRAEFSIQTARIRYLDLYQKIIEGMI
jgi:glycosyltransferase involved in cell wall biosynthesis